MTHYLDGAIQITGGRYFWPLDAGHPDNEIDIEFIAHSLAAQTRWGGILADRSGDPLHYSVAQHSVIVADLVNLGRAKLVPGWDWEKDASPAFYGLMHDASEAYLLDIPRPIKGGFTGYYEHEAALMRRILAQFAVPTSPAIVEAVKRVDNAMIFWERDAMAGTPVLPYSNECQHPTRSLFEIVPDFYPWDAKTAKREFLRKFEEINQHAGNHVPVAYARRGYGI